VSTVGSHSPEVTVRPTKLLFLPAAVLAATVAFGPGVAHANGNAPAGNNGTIKIDGTPAEDGNDNKPHPGCQFTVEFFGYDAGDRTATLEFEAQAPTDGGLLLEDTQHFTVAERTGGNQFDHRAEYDLSEALASRTPHPKQGYHVKLTVHVDGAQGADVKHKVFWVSECAAAGAFEAETPTTTVPPTTTTVAPVPVTTVGSTSSGSGATGVLGESETAPAAAPAAARGSLPRTGTTSGPMAAAALGLVAGGSALVAASRRRAASSPRR
jgi:LPXTG-motif cell wall-anchored protein